MSIDVARRLRAGNAECSEVSTRQSSEELSRARIEFFEESREAIAIGEDALGRLRSDPHDRTPLIDAARAIHTIKGSASVLGYPLITALAHALESAIEAVDDDADPPEPTTLDLLDESTAALDDLLVVRASGNGPAPEIDDLVDRLERLAGPRLTPPADGSGRLGDMLVSTGAAERLAVELAAAEQVLGNRQRLGEILVDRGDATPQRVAAALSAQTDAVACATSIRIDMSLLDDLLELIQRTRAGAAELDRLVRHDAPTARILAAAGSTRAAAAAAEELMRRSRRQPMTLVWRRLPRIVTHTAAELGKSVEVTTTGEDIVVDTTTLQSIVAPMTHLIRNAIDHGIEAPAVRLLAGKRSVGRLRLAAALDGGELVVEVADDGAGLDLETIRATALERALIGPATAARLTESEMAQLVFLPGLTTAGAVTRISGRGVGLDVVRAEITRLGGSLVVETCRGEGTVFTLRIPDRGERHDD